MVGILNATWAGAQHYTFPYSGVNARWGASAQHIDVQPIQAPVLGSVSTIRNGMVYPSGFNGLEFGRVPTISKPNQYVQASCFLDATWQGAVAYTGSFSVVSGGWIVVSHLYPAGISDDLVGEHELRLGQQFITTNGFDALSPGDGYVLHYWEYAYPEWVLDASWVGKTAYSSYEGMLDGVWRKPSVNSYIAVIGLNEAVFGTVKLTNEYEYLAPLGFNANAFGQASLNNNARLIQPGGIAPVGPPSPKVESLVNILKLASFVSELFGKPVIYNLRQYVVSKSYDAQLFGKAFMGGGVKTTTVSGFSAAAIPVPTVINTRANQTVNLSSPSRGIEPPVTPAPKVYPLIIFQKSFVATLFGNALVQFPPRPQGYVATRYGTAWVSHSPRYLNAKGFDSFVEGYPKVFDPKQTIYQQLTPITGGVFGDIKLRNVNSQIIAQGFDDLSMGQWLSVESNLRHIISRSDNLFTAFGEGAIFNKTPSISPKSIVGAIGQVYVDYAIRTIRVSGFAHYGFGRAKLTKPPELSPKGGYFFEAGEHTISNRVRTLFVDSIEAKKTSLPTVWHRVRQLFLAGGIDSLAFGKPKLEHGIRELLFKGFVLDGYGKPKVDFRVRYIDVESIVTITNSNHQVGGTQYLLPSGFDAARYGERIIPEAQNIYAKGIFSDFGLAKIWLYSQYLKPRGFDTENTFLHGRWGTQKLWNKRQYITMYYDPDSLLNPPKDNSKWLNISNRNRELSTFGSTLSLYGRPAVQNKAVPVYPLGKDWNVVGQHRISHFIQRVKCEPIEAPYISWWSNVHNNAAVLKAQGATLSLFGQPSVVNTRRYRRVEGFITSVFGYPLIADRIREITFESRYGIAPPRIELPIVDLYSRYVEPLGINKTAFGSIELNIYRAKIITRWSHAESAGTPDIRNVTPELKVRGKPSDEFGTAQLKLSKSYHNIEGYIATLIPKHRIEFKTREITVKGMQMMAFGTRIKLDRMGSSPYATQYISLEYPHGASQHEGTALDGYGIGVPGESYLGGPPTTGQAPQVPVPKFNREVITRVTINDASKFGDAIVSANTIRVEPGIQEFVVGEPNVTLKNRTIQPSSIESTLDYGKPRLNPHTIYAVRNGSVQAVRNHPTQGSINYVNEGIRLGSPIVTLQHRTMRAQGSSFMAVPQPTISLKINYVRPSGFSTLRFGWHSVPEWERTVTQFGSIESMIFGRPTVAIKYWDLRQYLKPKGIQPPVPSRHLVEFFHRQVLVKGFDAAMLGASIYKDTEFYPQSLNVGFPKPVRVVGKDASLFGKTYISHRVREVQVSGFDSFISTYTLEKYKDRMQVIRLKPTPPMYKVAHPLPTIMTLMGTPDIKLKVHYIRPDGNSDQYRKGAPQ